MKPRPTTDGDLTYWATYEPTATIVPDGPAGGDCPAVVTALGSPDGDRGPVIRVPWELDPTELDHITTGGTLWLSIWGEALPRHKLEVQPPDGAPPRRTRPLIDLRDSGMLWWINRVAFHPLGVALALEVDTTTGEVSGWALEGDGSSVWAFTEEVDSHRFAQAMATLDEARAGRPQPVEAER